MPDTTSPASVAPDASGVKVVSSSWSIISGRTFAGLGLILLPIIAQRFGYTIGAEDAQMIVQQVFAGIGALVAAYGRLAARKVLVPENQKPETRNLRPDSGFVSSRTLAALFLTTLAALCALLYLGGCATTTARGRVTNAVLLTAGKFAGKVVVSSVANLANDRAKGLQLDYTHAASAGLWANMDGVISSGDIERIVTAYAGPAAPALAAPLAAEFDAARPRTAADRSALVDSMARGISDAALALNAGREGK